MLLRAHEHKQMIWKNGGGITSEVARSPIDGEKEFDWRLSIGQVKAPGGPFSIFPGIDRTLCVLSQHGLYLTLNDGTNSIIHLNQDSLPYSFSGELSITCRVDAEILTDLNIMTRRGKFQHHLEQLKLNSGEEKTINASFDDEDVLFIIVGQGQVKRNDGIEMHFGDTLRLDQSPADIWLRAMVDDTRLYIVRITHYCSTCS